MNVSIPITETIYDDTALTVKVRKQIDETNWDEATSFSDSLGLTKKTVAKDSQGDVIVQTKYDNLGRVKATSNPYREVEANILWTTPTYDELNRTKFITTPDGAKVETQYSLATTGDQIGSVVTVIDQAGKKRRSITNALGLLTRVDEPNNAGILGDITNPTQPTFYEYDALNNLKKVTQGEQVRTFAYDSLSRLKTATNPESGTINYTYDLVGNLKTKTDARGIKAEYFYDKLSRVIKRNYTLSNGQPEPNSPEVNYFYDSTNVPFGKGKLSRVVTGSISNPFSETKNLAFDNFGRVKSSQQITDGVAYNPMTYSYNLSGALIEETYPSGRVVKNTLDQDGDLAIVQSSKSNVQGLKMYANAFTYTSAGAVSSLRLGNGKFENTQFNSRLQPIQIGLGSSATSQNLLKLNFDYGGADNNGNVKSQSIVVPNVVNPFVQAFEYDSSNRLKVAEEKSNNLTTWKQTFLIDRYGNRRFDQNQTTTISPTCQSQICNPQINEIKNRLIGAVYDDAGNITTNLEGETFIYDAENRQIQVSNSTGIIGQYFHDGEGKRIKKHLPNTGEITIFVYDFEDKLVAEYSTKPVVVADAKVSYTTTDNVGSPRITTDANGQVVSRHDLMPFGEEIQRANYGSDNIRNRFTSYERDNESNLDFAKNRYYRYSLGRFSTADPENAGASSDDPQSWNAYAYGRNNPGLYTDPEGLSYQICESATKCWTVSDYQFGKARAAGGFDFTGNGESMESGSIYSEDGVFRGTYRQISIDDMRQRQNYELFQGTERSMQWARPIINFYANWILPAFAVPGSGGAARTSIVAAGSRANQAQKILSPLNGILFNTAKGHIAEAMARNLLLKNGFEIIANNVYVKLPGFARGRYVDFLVKSPSGETIAIEIKSGAGRSLGQLAKDGAIRRVGGVLGKSAKEKAGQILKPVRTIELPIRIP